VLRPARAMPSTDQDEWPKGFCPNLAAAVSRRSQAAGGQVGSCQSFFSLVVQGDSGRGAAHVWFY